MFGINWKKIPNLLEETSGFQIVFRKKVPKFRLSSRIKSLKNLGTLGIGSHISDLSTDLPIGLKMLY